MDERALETAEKQRKSILYGGESIADTDALNTTVDTMNREVQALPGVQETVKGYQTETLTLEYPALTEDINRALAQGWNRDDLRKYLAGKEAYARTFYDQEKVDGLLGRTPETRKQFWYAMKLQQDDAYVRLMKGEMSEKRVRDVLHTARCANMNPGLLFEVPELIPEAERIAGERVGVFGQIQAAVYNAIAGHNQSSAGAERFEAAEMTELLKDRDALIAEGRRQFEIGHIPEAYSMTNPTDDELAELGRKSLEKKIAEKKKDAATDEEDAMRWDRHVRPPDSELGAFLLSAIESSGMTVMSSLRSRVAWALGGPIAGLFMSLYNTYDESMREAGETFMTALRRGMSDEDAYKAAVKTREKNLYLLGATNYAGDILTFGFRHAGSWLGKASKAGRALGRVGDFIDSGVESMADQWAGKITGKGLAETLARGVIRAVPLAAASAMEGFEESGQEWIKTDALGDAQDHEALVDAFRMGMGQSVIYSLVGLGGQKTLGAAWNKVVSKAPLAKAAQRMEKEVREAAELGEKLAKGEVNPDDIVGEDPVVFVPRDALSDTALLELAGDEVLEEVEETEAGEETVELAETPSATPDGETATETDPAEEIQEEATETEDATPEEPTEDTTPDELAVRQSTWDAWAAEHPEEAEGLKDHVRVGTRGVTAAEEFARKFDAVRKKAEDKLNADTPEAETARGIRDEVKAQLAEINKGLAKPLTDQAIEDEANIYGHMLLNTAENYGVSPEEVHRLRVKNGQDPVGKRERYAQIIGERGAANDRTEFPRVYREEQSAYDPDDPATWPEGPARDEALELKAWLDWDMLEEYKYLPDSVPEKAEALALMKEFNELDAWFEAADIETVKNDVEHNDRQNQIEKRLDEIDRILKKKMPKGAERRLEKLIEAEAQEAEREFQLYDEQGDTETYAQSRANVAEAQGLGKKTSITDVVNAAKTERGKKNPEKIWYDYARVTPEEAQRISQATGLDIDERYVHTFVGNGVTHTEKRHGIGNEKRHDQAPITAADYELVPYIIQNADKIALGTEKSTSGNNTIVYLKKIDGNTLVVEEVRSKRGKLAFYAMRKAKAGYTYDLTKPGHPIIKETAGSQGVTSKNAAQPEVGSPNAPSVATSLQQTGEDVNDATRGNVEFGPFSHTEAAIRMGTKADASTFLHELWHVALDDLLTFGRREAASEQAKADVATAMEWLGLTEADLENSERMREAQEKWAEAGESYFMSGKAPTTALQGVFERIRKWLLDIYNGVRGQVELNDDIREVFDHILATNEEITEAYEAATTVGELSTEDALIRERLKELEEAARQTEAELEERPGWLVDTSWLEESEREKLGDGQATSKETREQIRARLAEELKKYRDRAERLKRKQRQKKKLRRKILQMVNQIEAAAEDKKVIYHKQLEIREKLKGLDLKFRSKKVLEERREIAEYLSEHPEAARDMKPRKLKYLGMRTLNDISIKELWQLHKEILEMRAEGRRELEQKELLVTERIEKARAEIMATLEVTNGGGGDGGNDDKDGKGGDDEGKQPGVITGREDMGKIYRGVSGKVRKMMDWAYANTMGAQRFFDHLDGHRGTFNGPWVRLFVDQANAARDTELRHVFDRRLWIEKKMAELGIRPQDLAQERDPGVPRRNGEPWTVDKLLSIYAGMKNERSRKAILYGNFKGRWNPEADAARCVQALTDKERAFADAIIEEYELHFDRIDSALIAVYNKGMDHEENYTPMRRLEYTTAEGLMDPDSAEAMMDAREKAGGMGRVERGFQKNRVDMSRKNQRGIDLGLFSIWNSQVEVQEHAAAFAGLIRDLRRILVGRNTQTQEATVQQRLKEVYGKAAWENVKNYFNIIGKNDRKLAHDVLDGASNWLIKNMSTAYLCANLGTMLKQTTSFPRFLPYCGPVQMLKSIGELIQDPKGFMKWCFEQDPQLKSRQGNLILDAMRNAATGAEGVYQKALNYGMSGITFCDKLTTCIGWKAVYNANRKKGLSHDEAVREAQRAVILTQPTVHAKDAPAIWKARGLARLAMAFTNDMAQTFGITAYDLDAAIRRKDIPKALVTLTSVALAAGMMGLITTGGPDDDDEEGWLKWWGRMTLRQMAESIPLLGKPALSLWDSMGRSTGEMSPYIAPFARLLSGAAGLWDDKENNNERAVFDLIEAGALLSGFPSTGLSRIWRAGESMARGDVKKALKRMAGIRVQEKKLRGRVGM